MKVMSTGIKVHARQVVGSHEHMQHIASWCNGTLYGMCVGEVKRKIKLNCCGSTLVAQYRYWIVKNPTGTFSVYDPETFDSLYDIAED